MLFCCLFPWGASGLTECVYAKYVYDMAGIAKIDRMKYVNAFMKQLKALAILGIFLPISDMLYKDRKGKNGKVDVNPFKFLDPVQFGCIGEVALGPLCLFYPQFGAFGVSFSLLYFINDTICKCNGMECILHLQCTQFVFRTIFTRRIYWIFIEYIYP